LLPSGKWNPWASGTNITKLITAARTPRYLRIAAVVTFGVARFAFNLPARLWLSWNLTSQATSQNFMISFVILIPF
jgi:hypothetical protein